MKRRLASIPQLVKRCAPLSIAFHKPTTFVKAKHPTNFLPCSSRILAWHLGRCRFNKLPPSVNLSLLGSLPMGLSPELPPIMIILSILTGLPAALWIYKADVHYVVSHDGHLSAEDYIYGCVIRIAGYAPLGARKEELNIDVPSSYMSGISCEEINIHSERNVKLAGIVVSQEGYTNKPPETVIIYFQGNAGNPLHRLPVFQRLLHVPAVRSLLYQERASVVAVAPRSYWKSSSHRPTERGILVDYLHVLRYTLERFPTSRIVFYGHSLGGAASVCLLSQLSESANETRYHDPRYINIKGLILENPFASIPAMVRALYPQRWIPYHYLAPLAFDKWDAAGSMRALSNPTCANTVLKRLAGSMLVLVSENDEVVPPAMGTELYDAAVASLGDQYSPDNEMPRMTIIKGALHENAWDKRQWLPEMKRYLEGIRSV